MFVPQVKCSKQVSRLCFLLRCQLAICRWQKYTLLSPWNCVCHIEMRGFPCKQCLLYFPIWGPEQMERWPPLSGTRQVNCSRGKVRKHRICPLAQDTPGRLTCCRDEFWKHIQARIWQSPKCVGTKGSLSMTQMSAHDIALFHHFCVFFFRTKNDLGLGKEEWLQAALSVWTQSTV